MQQPLTSFIQHEHPGAVEWESLPDLLGKLLIGAEDRFHYLVTAPQADLEQLVVHLAAYRLSEAVPADEQATIRPQVRHTADKRIQSWQVCDRPIILSEKNRIERSRLILENERESAALEKQIVEAELKAAEQRVAEHARAVEAKRAELSAARVALDDFEIGAVINVAVALGAVIGSAFTGGATLAALPGLIVAAQGLWRELEYNESGKPGAVQFPMRRLAETKMTRFPCGMHGSGRTNLERLIKLYPRETPVRTDAEKPSGSRSTTTTNIGLTPPAAISPRSHAFTPASTTS